MLDEFFGHGLKVVVIDFLQNFGGFGVEFALDARAEGGVEGFLH
jgi:hypothetical protein